MFIFWFGLFFSCVVAFVYVVLFVEVVWVAIYFCGCCKVHKTYADLLAWHVNVISPE